MAMPASPTGKWKMGAQVATILLLILGQGHLSFLYPIGQVGLWMVLGLALWSAAEYYRRFNWMMSNPKLADFEAVEADLGWCQDNLEEFYP